MYDTIKYGVLLQITHMLLFLRIAVLDIIYKGCVESEEAPNIRRYFKEKFPFDCDSVVDKSLYLKWKY